MYRIALTLLSLAFTACASSSARQAAAPASAPLVAPPSHAAASRLGPPSPRGLGLRRVDRPTATTAPLAFY